MFDLSNAPVNIAERTHIDADELGQQLVLSARNWVPQMFPEGQRFRNELRIGSVVGEKGTSLSIDLDLGTWQDFATGESGTLLNLIAGLDVQTKGNILLNETK